MLPAGEDAMGRAGRKRKAGRRHPSGQLVRDKQPDDRVRTSRQPHRRNVKKEDRLSERAESPLGRLALKGVIAETSYLAGELYVSVVGKYRSIIEAPRGTSGSGRGSECSELCAAAHAMLSAEQRLEIRDGLFTSEACRCLVRKRSYDDAFETLMHAGQLVAKVVARVVIQHEEPRAEEIVYLNIGLTALARHFGLTARAGRAHYENAN